MATENKNLSQYNKETLPNVTAKRFGIITSEWNETVTQGMRKRGRGNFIRLWSVV